MEQISPLTTEMQKKWSLLPPALQKQVLDFIDFLLNKYQHFHSLSLTSPLEVEPVAAQQPRVLGLHAGMGSISPDFNDPLPDPFWLGDEV
ncbi:MAG: DUF2281 domain-containing protein [Synechococcales cyanobacterium CRU_2_2]|nr:DUF2281 domain-containing protein [Synechococcales cyanobacterium CRU_2_2]